MSGTIMVIKAPAVRMCQSRLRSPIRLAGLAATTTESLRVPGKTGATSRSLENLGKGCQASNGTD